MIQKTKIALARCAAALIVAFALGVALPAYAVSGQRLSTAEKFIWTGAGGDAKFSTPKNWMNNAVPVPLSILVFPAQPLECGPKTVKLKNDLPYSFSGIHWLRENKTYVKTLCKIDTRAEVRRFIEIDKLAIVPDGEARKVVSNEEGRYSSRIAVNKLTLEGDFTLTGGPLYTPNDRDTAPFPVAGKLQLNAGASAYRKLDDASLWVQALYKPMDVIGINAEGSIKSSAPKFQLTSEILENVWGVFCFNCDLIVTEDIFREDIDIHISTIPSLAYPARIVHEDIYSAQENVILRAWFHSYEGVYGFVNFRKPVGSLMLQGYRYWGVPEIQQQPGGVGTFSDETIRVR